MAGQLPLPRAKVEVAHVKVTCPCGKALTQMITGTSYNYPTPLQLQGVRVVDCPKCKMTVEIPGHVEAWWNEKELT